MHNANAQHPLFRVNSLDPCHPYNRNLVVVSVVVVVAAVVDAVEFAVLKNESHSM